MGIAEETLVPDPVLLITQAKTERLIKKLSIKYGSLVVYLKVLKDFDKSRLYFLGLIRLKRPFPPDEVPPAPLARRPRVARSMQSAQNFRRAPSGSTRQSEFHRYLGAGP